LDASLPVATSRPKSADSGQYIFSFCGEQNQSFGSRPAARILGKSERWEISGAKRNAEGTKFFRRIQNWVRASPSEPFGVLGLRFSGNRVYQDLPD
jgi:hypothetical protein